MRVTVLSFTQFSILFVLGLIGTVAGAAPPAITIYGTTAASAAGTTYTAGTIASGSSVQFDDGTIISGSSPITINGLLQINQSAGSKLIISNTIAGSGTLSLINTNSGTLQLTGTGASNRLLPLNMTISTSNGRLMGPQASGTTTEIGIFQLGASGTGTLNVAGGFVTGSAWQIGVGSTGVGTVTVTGGTFGPFGALTVGGSSGGSGGTGTLTINGGVVGDNPQTPLNVEGFRFGVGQNSSGFATITNGTLGASATGNGGSFIGLAGTGSVGLNSGYLQAGHLTLGSGSTGRGTLSIASGSASTNILTIGGTGNGTLTITGGAMKSANGFLGQASSGTGTVTVSSGTWLVNGNGVGGEIFGVLRVGGTSGGTGSLTINSGGYVVVSSTFTTGSNGTFALNPGGTLQIGGQSGVYTSSTATGTASSVGSGTMGVLAGNLSFAGTLKFAQNNTSGTLASSTYAGNLSGSGDLVKTGTGLLTLSGSNSYTGGTTLTGGLLALGSANAIGTTGTLTFNGGGLQVTVSNTTDYSARFSDAANQQYRVDSNGFDITLANDLTSAGGSFTKLGSGTITLTGSNTFTSGSAAAGVLQGTATNLATSGTFGAASGAEVRFNQTAPNETWAGAMVGSGTFTKLGAGTLTLTGSGADINGTLIVSAGAVKGTTDSIRRNVVNNSQLTFDQTKSGTYTRNMTGTGNVLLLNSGTITWTVTNNFTGTTTVAGGRLIGTTFSIPGDVINNSAVEFSQTFTGTYAGDMSGSGLLTKTGNGTVTLTGSNSYQGGTFVNAGALIGDTGSLQGSIAVASGTLGFDQATSGTYSGLLLGTSTNSRFVKTGVGDLTLSGTNTNDGAWTVSGGRLIGTTSSLQGSITNNAAVTFDQATNGTYAGTMSGSGSLTKAGAGAVTLTGSSGYSGATTVAAGSLLVSGSLSNSAVFVNTGALLGGGGVIGQMVTLSGGTISPGTGAGIPGLFTIGGLSASAGGTTLLDIIGSGTGAGTAGIDYDKLLVTGSGGLGYGGTLTLSFANASDFADGTTFDLFGFTGSASGSL
ncbi:MAG: autotransporter-associated beta strand repeat-containing protein, partial [Planctomycetes bacterium]|nr:autotransporter-associated beta strand repeat-containing protein [Planctomycetota bacterium]